MVGGRAVLNRKWGGGKIKKTRVALAGLSWEGGLTCLARKPAIYAPVGAAVLNGSCGSIKWFRAGIGEFKLQEGGAGVARMCSVRVQKFLIPIDRDSTFKWGIGGGVRHPLVEFKLGKFLAPRRCLMYEPNRARTLWLCQPLWTSL